MKCEMHHYLSFDGNAAEAFAFYQQALGGELQVMKHSEMPAPEGTPPPPADMADKVLHARLSGDGFSLMASDISPAHFQKPNPMVQISVNVHSAEDGDALFNKLSAGGQVFMPMQKTFWAERFGMFADKYGFSWMINYEAGK